LSLVSPSLYFVLGWDYPAAPHHAAFRAAVIEQGSSVQRFAHAHARPSTRRSCFLFVKSMHLMHDISPPYNTKAPPSSPSDNFLSHTWVFSQYKYELVSCSSESSTKLAMILQRDYTNVAN
jgi:hypothetical protein